MTDVSEALSAELQPPMANGEVLFEQPWQGRVFAMAVALNEAGVFAWSEFQAQLIEVIGQWEGGANSDAPYEYYDHFQSALNRLLNEKTVVSDSDLAARTTTFAQRPHGHDHSHERVDSHEPVDSHEHNHSHD